MAVVTADAAEGASTEITGRYRKGSGCAGRAFAAAAGDGPKVLWRSEGGRERRLGHIARPSQRHESDRGHRCRWWLGLIHQLNRARS